MEITLIPLSPEHVPILTSILNQDLALREALSISGTLSEAEFLATSTTWTRKHASTTYTILLDRDPIGILSISNCNDKEVIVRIGYWLASNHWNKGYGSRAFALALSIARDKGAKVATATIPNTSRASYRMWEKMGAVFEELGSSHIAQLDLAISTPQRPARQ